MELMVGCAICKGDGELFHIEEGGRLYRCKRCGVIFLYPRPGRSQLQKIYAATTGKTFDRVSEKGRGHERFLEARLRYMITKKYLQGCKRVVEIGCGGGYFLRYLRMCGYRVFGTELSEELALFASDVLGVDTIVGEIGALRQNGDFDVVVLFEVISHLDDPYRALQHLRGLLKDGGILIIQTGNGAELKASGLRQWGVPEHLFHFSERNLRSLLRSTGFEPLRCIRFNLLWQRLFLDLIGSLRKSRASSDPGPGQTRRKARVCIGYLSLFLRYLLGMIKLPKRGFCTMFFIARKR
jgi:2-polyprenyl-3-methyl-5-hydroxy-6-metoxy-1,4-benzoquinol methylase